MLRPALVAAALCGALTVGASPAQASPTSVRADLRNRLHSALAQSTASSISASFDVDGLGSVYAPGATTSQRPASTEKLFTTFAALKQLGADGRLRTQLRSPVAQRGPYLEGDVYLVGVGDAYFTTPQLETLASAVRAKGIRKITGALIVDDSRYDAARRAPGWKSYYVPDESGPLDALALDKNAWKRGSAYVADPALPVLGRLAELLRKHGVAVGTTQRRAVVPATATVLASHVSASVADIVRRINKGSDNFAAELLHKELGAVVRRDGSSAGGAAAVRDVLAPLGVTVGTVADGSGLSSRGRQTAAGEMSLLKAAEASSVYSALRRSLPIACKDGTLEKRMCGTAAAGKAIAKTGTLDYTSTLTGWTTTADGHTVRFAILLSGTTSSTKARQALDACVVLLSAARVS